MPDPSSEMPHYQETLAKLDVGTGDIGTGLAMPHQPTVTELLEHKKLQLERELVLVNAALAQAKENQGAMNLIDSIAKTRVSSRL